MHFVVIVIITGFSFLKSISLNTFIHLQSFYFILFFFSTLLHKERGKKCLHVPWKYCWNLPFDFPILSCIWSCAQWGWGGGGAQIFQFEIPWIFYLIDKDRIQFKFMSKSLDNAIFWTLTYTISIQWWSLHNQSSFHNWSKHFTNAFLGKITYCTVIIWSS